MQLLRRVARSRPLRLLLAAALVPVVVFSNPLAASAATSGVLTYAMGGIGSGNVSCRLPWVVQSGGLTIGASARCDGPVDWSPGYCQAYEGDCGSYGLVVKGLDGETCGSAAFDPFSDASNTVRAISARLGGGFVAIDWDACDPVEACLSYYLANPTGGTSTDDVSCVVLDVTEPTTSAPGGECPVGTPHVEVFWKTLTPSPYSGEHTLQRLYARFTLAGSPAVSTGGWGLAILGKPGPSQQHFDASTTEIPLNFEYQYHTVRDAPYPLPTGMRIEAYAYGYPNAWNGATFPNGNAAGAVQPPFPPGQFQPFNGWTDAVHCRFYFGPKVVDDPNSTGDEPAGTGLAPYVAPPTPTPTTLTPPEDDTPDTDSGLWGAILAALRALASAITELVRGFADLVKNLMKGLKDLFIPSGDGWGVDSLVEQFESKPPFSLVSALEQEARSMGLAYRAGGSCGTIANFGPGMTLDCATIQAVPGFSGLYALVSAGLMGLTGWSMFIMVSRTLEAGQ